jgi:hypothetical protein
MNAPVGQLNILFAGLGILLGFVFGLILGMFFHSKTSFGAFGSVRRRMYRLVQQLYSVAETRQWRARFKRRLKSSPNFCRRLAKQIALSKKINRSIISV